MVAEVSLRAGRPDAGPQPPVDELRGSRTARQRQRVRLQRHPRFLAFGEGKPLGHDAHDGGRLAVGAHRAADDLRIGAEVGRPRPIPEDEHRPRARHRVAGHDSAPEERLDTQDAEPVAGHEGAAQPFRLSFAHHDVEAREPGGGQALERALGDAPVLVVVDADADLPLPGGRVADRHGHDPVALGDRQAAQEDAVPDAEEQRRQGDAKGERDHGRRRQAGLPDEHADRHPPVAK